MDVIGDVAVEEAAIRTPGIVHAACQHFGARKRVRDQTKLLTVSEFWDC